MSRALLFDFGGTLDADGLTWKERFQSLCDVSDRAFYDADDALVGTIPKETTLAETVGMLAETLCSGGRLARRYDDNGGRGRPPLHRAVAEAFLRDAEEHLAASATLIRQLKKRYRIAIVSNFYGNLERVCRDAGIEADAFIDSCDVACSKPDAKIFQAALDALGVEARDAIFIGDSPHRDMAGARALGMPHVWLTRDPNAAGCCPGDRVIHRLADLAITAGGIIAAGEGSRLRSTGLPKPLVRVNGVPLIEHAIRNFEAAGIERLVVVFNENEGDCRDFVRERFPNVEVILKTTASSLETFRLVHATLGERALISTVDALCPAEDFARFLRAAEMRDGVVLAVTSFVDDERPLWVTVAPDGRITTIGESSGNAVTAGMYAVPAALPSGGDLGRLREYLAWLVAAGVPAYGEWIEKVVDVDRPEDVLVAERSL